IARAGIRLDEAELEQITAGTALDGIDALDRVIAQVPSDTVPDYLKDWTDHRADDQPAAADHADDSADTTDPLDPFAPLHTVATAIADRKVSPVEITALMLERIARYDPALNAYQLVLADQARAAAREAEREIAAGQYRGPFHGVPVA